MVPYNHLNKLNNRFAYFSSELDVVCINLIIINFVVSTIIFGFL
jgi:hypothetical protein